MKKISLLIIPLLICMASLTACKKADDTVGNMPQNNSLSDNKTEDSIQSAPIQSESISSEPAQPESEENILLKEQREWYALYIKKLDQLLAENRANEQSYERYRESIWSIYLYPESYSGGLQADYSEDGMKAFQIITMDDIVKEKQRYECRLLPDGSIWFTYQTESVCENNLPAYLVNEDILRFDRVDYVYDDGKTDIEEKRQLRIQEAEQYMVEKTGGEVQEFWYWQEHLYRIDREAESFSDVTDQKECCIVDFLQEQAARINCQLAVREDSLEVVEKYKPEGYSLLWENGWNDIAVCDLNHDDRMDYVVVLYPDDYEEVRKYADDSPYEKSSQYYAACFWLLLSSEDGGYEQIGLSSSIEYWEDALVLLEVSFVDEGLLQLEYFIGRSPFSDAQLLFQYDEEKKNFYMYRSYYRDYSENAFLIGDMENYGETSMLSYFAYRQNYCEGIWQSVDDVSMQDGTILGYYSDSFQYRCENLLEEHHINGLIWGKEYELIQTLKQFYPDKELDVHMVAKPVFYNQRLVSGRVELYGYDRYDRVFVPIMVDKQNGKIVSVTELLEKERFARIFAQWSSDVLLYGRITAEEKKQCEEVIEKHWEDAGKSENYFGRKEDILFLQIVEAGIRIGVWSQADEQMKYYVMDKEYFWGTEVWGMWMK